MLRETICTLCAGNKNAGLLDSVPEPQEDEAEDEEDENDDESTSSKATRKATTHGRKAKKEKVQVDIVALPYPELEELSSIPDPLDETITAADSWMANVYYFEHGFVTNLAINRCETMVTRANSFLDR